ncbi:hypothetical protein [Spiroplasma chrysopicola]|uniref:Transmembrane protein n=1 Tax=Spiroplasma chrysopicola DF-1 TaxID=1276227 RepID=R4UBL7_9MOLU|nr:hypothetical protein [Spiroplasma chrysopicola]AGM25299.1 hypothetical protein SCHRY_v1c07230 [Spiroplasma chrysopicola DF-1]
MPFYLIIVEILMYAALAIYIILVCYLLFGYLKTWLQPVKVISYYFLGINFVLMLINLGIIIIAFLSLFNSELFGDGSFATEKVILNFVSFAISSFILTLLITSYCLITSNYFSFYQKNDQVYLFGSLLKIEKMTVVKKTNQVLILKKRFFYQIYFAPAKVYQNLQKIKQLQ